MRLGSRGYRVTVLERLEQPGGRARVHRRDGFTFDAGPTIVTAPFLFEELWQLAGKRMADDVTMVPMDPFYRIRFSDGATFDYSGDPERMRAEVARFSAVDVAGYERFMAHARKVCALGFEQLGFERLKDQDPARQPIAAVEAIGKRLQLLWRQVRQRALQRLPRLLAHR